MIEGRISPIGRLVARGAIASKSAIVFISLLMAGVAVCGSVLLHIVEMAPITFHFGVCAFEFEG